MDLFGRNVKCFTRAREPLDQRLAVLDPQDDLAGENVDRLILLIVILQREHVARLDMQDLAGVLVGFRPDKLVSPGLVHPVREPAPAHANLNFSDDGTVTHAVTHTPQPTQPSGLSTGRPRSSSARAFSPIGQARAQTPHSAPWNVIQRCGSSSRVPMCTWDQGIGVRAPVSHALAHGMSSHAMHDRVAGSM